MLVLVIGGTGYLYGGLIGAVVFRMLQEVFSTITPQYWQFWIGARAGRDRAGRPRRGCIAGCCFCPTSSSRSFAGRKAAVAVPEGDAP